MQHNRGRPSFCHPYESGFHTQLVIAMHMVRDSRFATQQMETFCERHDKASLERVRFWLFAHDALGVCNTAAEVDALFLSLLPDYIRDDIEKDADAPPSSVTTVRDLFYGSCARVRLTLANRAAAYAKWTEITNARKAKNASDDEEAALAFALSIM